MYSGRIMVTALILRKLAVSPMTPPLCTPNPTLVPAHTRVQVCERTAADKKGGHLARRKSDGKLLLRESAMCPDADKKHFEDIALHR